MELSIRDWMVIIGALLFFAVILDGYRRMQRDRRQQVKITRRAEKSQFSSSDYSSTSNDLGNKRLLNTLETSVNDEDRYDPLFHNPFDLDDSQALVDTDDSASFNALDEDDALLEPVDDAPEDDAEQDLGEPDEILIIHVLASDEPFQGAALETILTACDCRLNKQHIFQRHEQNDGLGAVQFSVVNAVEPGIFDKHSLAQFSTPGLSFFMRLPGPSEPMQAYNNMVEVARCISKNLHGTLHDEQRSTMTEQTLEHGRQRIRDYLQHQLTEHGER